MEHITNVTKVGVRLLIDRARLKFASRGLKNSSISMSLLFWSWGSRLLLLLLKVLCSRLELLVLFLQYLLLAERFFLGNLRLSIDSVSVSVVHRLVL